MFCGDHIDGVCVDTMDITIHQPSMFDHVRWEKMFQLGGVLKVKLCLVLREKPVQPQ